MKISIITVAFNAAHTVADTLESVADQAHAEIEHIVVDGASTDGTIDVIRRNGERVARLISEPDHGIYDAMNKGLRLATGAVIGFLNADDVYADPGVIARVSAIMEKEKLDALFGDVEFVSPGRRDRPLRRYRSERFRPDRLGWGWMPAHPALFMRREVFERAGGFSTDYKIAGDFEFIVRAFHETHLRYRHLPEVLVTMRTGGVSTAGLRSKILLNREVLRACRKNGVQTNMLKILAKYPAKILELFNR